MQKAVQSVPLDMLTTTEAAVLLNLSRSGVKSAVMRGRLIGEKRGRRWYISPVEVERYRAFHMHEQGSNAPIPAPLLPRKPRGGGRQRRTQE